MNEAPAVTEIDIETFYYGLILGLAANGCREFVADGPQYHDAFEAAVQRARELPRVVVEDMEWMNRDLLYGTMLHAESMLMFGTSARMLSLMSPELVRAHIRYPEAQAREELHRLGHFGWFDDIGKVFADQLSDKNHLRPNVSPS